MPLAKTESTVRVVAEPMDPEEAELSAELRIGTSQVLYRLETRMDDTIDLLARALQWSREARREGHETAVLLDAISLDEGYSD